MSKLKPEVERFVGTIIWRDADGEVSEGDVTRAILTRGDKLSLTIDYEVDIYDNIVLQHQSDGGYHGSNADVSSITAVVARRGGLVELRGHWHEGGVGHGWVASLTPVARFDDDKPAKTDHAAEEARVAAWKRKRDKQRRAMPKAPKKKAKTKRGRRK